MFVNRKIYCALGKLFDEYGNKKTNGILHQTLKKHTKQEKTLTKLLRKIQPNEISPQIELMQYQQVIWTCLISPTNPRWADQNLNHLPNNHALRIGLKNPLEARRSEE